MLHWEQEVLHLPAWRKHLLGEPCSHPRKNLAAVISTPCWLHYRNNEQTSAIPGTHHISKELGCETWVSHYTTSPPAPPKSPRPEQRLQLLFDMHCAIWAELAAVPTDPCTVLTISPFITNYETVFTASARFCKASTASNCCNTASKHSKATPQAPL